MLYVTTSLQFFHISITGIHGLCNAELNCSWTKVQEGKRMFSQIVEDSHSKEDLVERLFQLMKDDTQ